jgi:hypothetical protein
LFHDEDAALATSGSNRQSQNKSKRKVRFKNATVEETFEIPDLAGFENCNVKPPTPSITLRASAESSLVPSANGFIDETAVISLLIGGLASRI